LNPSIWKTRIFWTPEVCSPVLLIRPGQQITYNARYRPAVLLGHLYILGAPSGRGCTSHEKTGNQPVVEGNQEKQNRIMTSVLTHSEALPKRLTEKDATKEEQYWSYFNGRYFTDVDISRPIIALAREIRDFYYKPFDEETQKYQMIGLGDSIHLATAIIYRADEFHTREKKTQWWKSWHSRTKVPHVKWKNCRAVGFENR
jgi:hypothetical protein